jgi:alkylated DNA repair dioxygenase AlkB
MEPAFPEGFTYIPDFLNGAEELTLCNFITHIELHPFQFQGFEAKRKVASFGYDYNFENRNLSSGKGIPAEFNFIIARVADRVSIEMDAFKELLITEYPVGSVINWHRDAQPFDVIAGISLASDCRFKLRPHDKNKQTRSNTHTIILKRCSLYLMQGAARTDWQHSIAPVQNIRYSITLRTLKNSHLIE